MSYSLFGNQGHIQPIASVGGMNDLLDFVERLRVFGPLKEFLDYGETSNVKGVIDEITVFLPYCSNPGVKSTLLELKQGLEKVQGTAVISE